MNFDIKKYFDMELRTVLIYVVAAVIMGYVSFLINHTLYAAFAMLAVLAALTTGMKFLFKKNEDYKWWMSNGGLLYIFVWFIVWTIFYNVYVV